MITAIILHEDVAEAKLKTSTLASNNNLLQYTGLKHYILIYFISCRWF